MRPFFTTFLTILAFHLLSQSINLSLGVVKQGFIGPERVGHDYFDYNFDPRSNVSLGIDKYFADLYLGLDITYNQVKGTTSIGTGGFGGGGGSYANYNFKEIGLRLWFLQLNIFKQFKTTIGIHYKFPIYNKSNGGQSYYVIGMGGGRTNEELTIGNYIGITTKLDYEYCFLINYSILPTITLYLGAFEDYSDPSFIKSFSITLRRYFSNSNP